MSSHVLDRDALEHQQPQLFVFMPEIPAQLSARHDVLFDAGLNFFIVHTAEEHERTKDAQDNFDGLDVVLVGQGDSAQDGLDAVEEVLPRGVTGDANFAETGRDERVGLVRVEFDAGFAGENLVGRCAVKGEANRAADDKHFHE